MIPILGKANVNRATLIATLSAFLFAPVSAHARAVKLQFTHPVEVSVPNRTGLGKTEAHKPNASINLAEDTIYWINAKGKVPMLVVPIDVKSGQDTVRVKMPEVALWPSSVAERELETKMTAAIDQLIKFQIAISQKDIETAEKALNELERIKSLEYYHLLRASLRFVKGDLAGAKESVERGLKRYPANEHGQQMLKLLEENKQ